jgi:hypothetical protein
MMLPMYLLEFEAASDMAGWSYERKGKELCSRIKDKALLAVHQTHSESERLDYNSLTAALFAEYLPSACTISANMRLNSCTQGDMSVRAYGNQLRKLSMLAYPPGAEGDNAKHRDRRALDRFMVTLNVGDVRVKVLEAKPTTLRQAMNVATEYLAILDPTGQEGSAVGLDTGPTLSAVERSRPYPIRTHTDLPRSQSVPSPERPSGENSQASESLQLALQRLTELLAKLEANGNVSTPRRRFDGPDQTRAGKAKYSNQRFQPPNRTRDGDCNRKCYRCGKEGHFARECTSSSGQQCVQGTCVDGATHACYCSGCHFVDLRGPGSHKSHPKA